MAESLFTSQTPVATDASDGTPSITTATTVIFAADGTVSGIRFYATANASTGGGTYTVGLWELTSNGAGTLLATATIASGSLVNGTWNVVNFASPVAVTGNTKAYRAILHSGTSGRYVATNNFFASSGLTNGNISAPQDNTSPLGYTIGQGTFAIGSAPTSIPSTTSGSPASYFVDVVYTAGVSSESHTDSAAVTLALTLTATAVKRGVSSAALSLGLTGSASDLSHRLAAVEAALHLTLSATARNGDTVAGGSGGWWSLISILREEAATISYYNSQPPTACPNDGEPLIYGPDGRLFCRFDGWIWNGSTVR